MEKICGLLTYVNGHLDDESDDLIDDSQLYFMFVRLAARARGLDDKDELQQALNQVLSDYEEPIPGAKARIEKVLRATDTFATTAINAIPTNAPLFPIILPNVRFIYLKILCLGSSYHDNPTEAPTIRPRRPPRTPIMRSPVRRGSVATGVRGEPIYISHHPPHCLQQIYTFYSIKCAKILPRPKFFLIYPINLLFFKKND